MIDRLQVIGEQVLVIRFKEAFTMQEDACMLIGRANEATERLTDLTHCGNQVDGFECSGLRTRDKSLFRPLNGVNLWQSGTYDDSLADFVSEDIYALTETTSQDKKQDIIQQ